MARDSGTTVAVILGLAALGACGSSGGDPGFIVMSTQPSGGALLAQPPTAIVIRFSHDLDPSTVVPDAFRILGSGGDGTFEDGNETVLPPLPVLLISRAKCALI